MNDNTRFYPESGEAMLSYSIVAASDAENIATEKAAMSAFAGYKYGQGFKYLDYTIAANGIDNLLPTECINMIRQNPVLARILKKQINIMFGKGLALFQDAQTDDEITRMNVSKKYPEVFEWARSWEKMGLPSLRTYLQGIMFDYFYHEMYYSEYHLNTSARIGKMPIAALKHSPANRNRLGTKTMHPATTVLEDSMLELVLHNQWDYPFKYEILEYDRFNPANPFSSNSAISVVRDLGAGEEIYSIPTAYYGLRNWIKVMNLNAPRIDSFLNNSFTARKHVEIPQAWIVSKQSQLEKICALNKDREAANEPLQTQYEGIAVGTVFNHNMVNQIIDKKMAALVSVMSGAGENQGKTFFTTSFLSDHGIERWVINDIPTNFKDFTDSLISTDKHALRNILAGIGLDPAISNVSNEGVVNSGAQVYYSYLVYLDTLHLAETIILEDFNRAISLNFPRIARDGVTAGFMRYAPQRQQEQTPEDRYANQKQ